MLLIVDDPNDDFTPVGLITDRDTVGAIMRTPLVTASDSEDSSAAIARMRHHGVRRLPVQERRATR